MIDFFVVNTTSVELIFVFDNIVFPFYSAQVADNKYYKILFVSKLNSLFDDLNLWQYWMLPKLLNGEKRTHSKQIFVFPRMNLTDDWLSWGLHEYKSIELISLLFFLFDCHADFFVTEMICNPKLMTLPLMLTTSVGKDKKMLCAMKRFLNFSSKISSFSTVVRMNFFVFHRFSF